MASILGGHTGILEYGIGIADGISCPNGETVGQQYTYKCPWHSCTNRTAGSVFKGFEEYRWVVTTTVTLACPTHIVPLYLCTSCGKMYYRGGYYRETALITGQI